MKNFTPDSIIKYAQENNMPFEYYTNRFDRWGNIGSFTTDIGVMLSDGIWYWWEFHALESGSIFEEVMTANPEPYLCWKQRYSQITGRTVRGFRTGFNAQCKILDNQ